MMAKRRVSNEPGEANGRQILGTGNFTSKPEQGTKQKDESRGKEARAMKARKFSKMEKLRRKQDEEIRRKNKQKQMKN